MNLGGLAGSLLGAFGGRTLGRMLGGSTGGMIGSLAGSMLGGRGVRGAAGGLGGLGGMLGGLMGGDGDEAEVAPSMPDNEAEVLIRAMCNAAKADGHVDDDEIQAILGRLDGASDEEREYVRAELDRELDAAAFIRSVPEGMEAQVYAASLLAIEVDTKAEADYLSNLAAGLGLSRDTVDQIHTELSVEA